MRKYTVMVEGCRWLHIEATSPEIAWRSQKVWFMPNKQMIIRDDETGRTWQYLT